MPLISKPQNEVSLLEEAEVFVPQIIARSSRFDFDLAQARMLFWCMSMIRSMGSQYRGIAIPFPTFCRMCNLTAWNKPYLLEQLKALPQAEFIVPKESKRIPRQLALVRKVNVSESRDIISFEFDPHVVKLLQDTDAAGGYTWIKLNEVLSVQTVRSMRLLLLVRHMAGLISSTYRTVPLSFLRQILDLRSKSHDTWANVKLAIERSAEDIKRKTNTDLEHVVTLVPIRHGLPVTRIRFDRKAEFGRPKRTKSSVRNH